MGEMAEGGKNKRIDQLPREQLVEQEKSWRWLRQVSIEILAF